MKLRYFPLLFIPVLFSACGNHSHDQVAIELNNGQKWKVNEEMKRHIEKGRELLNTYLAEGNTDHKQLAADIQQQNSKLIKSCTMDGKSHDELHNWLHPHLELVKSLRDAEAEDEAAKTINELKASYELYDQYFE